MIDQRSSTCMFPWVSRAFWADGSFAFAVQIPDNRVGCSGSLCSHCGAEAAYCDQVCSECGLPFVGPFGFPQLLEWESMPVHVQRAKAKEVYRTEDRGRIRSLGVHYIPLTLSEAVELQRIMTARETYLFEYYHGVTLENFVRLASKRH